MSTRCNIVTMEANGDRYPVLIYKHCDGYPGSKAGVMSWLCPFARLFSSNRGDDAEYFVAQVIRHKAVAEAKEHDGQLQEAFTGWGLCTEEHGDIAYLYEVTPATGRVVCRDSSGKIVAEQGPGEVWEETKS